MSDTRFVNKDLLTSSWEVRSIMISAQSRGLEGGRGGGLPYKSDGMLVVSLRDEIEDFGIT